MSRRDLGRRIAEVQPAPIREAAGVYWNTIVNAFYAGLAEVAPDEKPDGSLPQWEELDDIFQRAFAHSFSHTFEQAVIFNVIHLAQEEGGGTDG